MIKAHHVTEELERNGFHYAIPLWQEMTDLAETDMDYCIVFDDWLENGGTVKLRDELCDQFREHTHLFEDHEVHKKPWLDAWMAIATARHQIINASGQQLSVHEETPPAPPGP